MSLFGPNVSKLEQRRDSDGLVKCLDHRDPSIRKAAVDALARLKVDASIGALIGALAHSDREVRSTAFDALEATNPNWRSHRLADVAGDEIVSKLKSPDPAERFAAASALNQFPVQKSLAPLIELAQHDPEEQVRARGARALGELGDRRAVAPLIDVLRHDRSKEVRLQSAVALGNLGDRRAVQPLLELVRGSSGYFDDSHLVGVRALRNIGAVGELIELLNEDIPGVEERAVKDLRQLTGLEFHEASAWSDWWKNNEATFRPRTRVGSSEQLPVLFGSPREICQRIFSDYDLSPLNSAQLVAAAIQFISKRGQLEPALEAGLAIAGLAEPLAALKERLSGWGTSAVIELGILEKELSKKAKGV
jgi:HEAT repeat protein